MSSGEARSDQADDPVRSPVAPTIDELVAIPTFREDSAIVWRLAWPAVALNSMQVVNALLDTSFIGHLQAAVMTAVGGMTTAMFLLFSMAMAMGTAPTAIVSRAFGAGDLTELKTATRQANSLGLVLGAVCTVLGYLSAVPIAQALIPAGDIEAKSLMISALRIWVLGLPAIFLIQSLAGSMRAVGDTKSPMVISGIQILLHIALNYLLIFPPRHTSMGVVIPGADMGLNGATTAMVCSAWISSIIYLAWTVRTPLGSCWKMPLPDWGWARRLLKIAIPAAAASLIRVSSLAIFTFILKHTPGASTAIGAMRVGFAVESMMFMPAFGLSIAAATLVGQSLGRAEPDRAERLGWIASHHAALVTIVVAIPVFVFAPQIASNLLEHKAELAAEAATMIRWLCVTEVAFAYAMVAIGAMQGAGDTTRTTWITILALWGVRVPLAYCLAIPAGLGSVGAWIAMSLSQAMQGLLAVAMYRQGRWKTKVV